MPKSAPENSRFSTANHVSSGPGHGRAAGLPIIALGWSLGLFLSLTFVICVLFDLWFPAYAMNAAWAVLLPGFSWISWPNMALGLIETFAYGWYFALVFGGLYNFVSRRSTARRPI